jgi:hypothetical protein
MLCRVALERADVSEERIASIIRVTRIDELGTALTLTRNRRMLRKKRKPVFLARRFLSPGWGRRNVLLNRRFLQEPHGVTSQKTAFLILHIFLKRLHQKDINMSVICLLPMIWFEGGQNTFCLHNAPPPPFLRDVDWGMWSPIFLKSYMGYFYVLLVHLLIVLLWILVRATWRPRWTSSSRTFFKTHSHGLWYRHFRALVYIPLASFNSFKTWV